MSKASEFIDLLRSQVNRGIYVWGAYVKLPALPSAAGTYALKVTVTASGKTLSWV